jgi:RNA polymerase sigma-70 factor (ECF subfamily)
MAKNCRMDLNWIEARNVAKKTILRYAKTIDRDLLEDIAQDTIERALLKISHFNLLKGNFNAWISVIARNTFIDFTRKKGIIVPICRELNNISIEDNTDASIKEDLELHLLSAFNTLKEREKLLIKLRYLDNKSFEEISQITGIQEKSVPVYIMRARKEMKNHITYKSNLYAA